MKHPIWHLNLLAVGVATATLCAGNGPGPGRPERGEAFDLNDDGTITAEEFSEAGEAMVADLQAAFLEKFDTIPEGAEAGDGVITDAESLAVFLDRTSAWAKHTLDTLDRNEDGVISQADTGRGRWRVVWRQIGEYDADADGGVTAAELTAAALAKAEAQQAQFLEIYDTVPAGAETGDGIITAEESLAVHTEVVARRIEAFLDRHDANGDGTVTEAELQGVHRKGPPRGKGTR
jgi:Ca2+-binding EF-hand superfamily protein